MNKRKLFDFDPDEGATVTDLLDDDLRGLEYTKDEDYEDLPDDGLKELNFEADK